MIAYETSTHDVRKVSKGHYEVYRSGVTHATRCATIVFKNDDSKALRRAIAECDRRHAAAQTA